MVVEPLHKGQIVCPWLGTSHKTEFAENTKLKETIYQVNISSGNFYVYKQNLYYKTASLQTRNVVAHFIQMLFLAIENVEICGQCKAGFIVDRDRLHSLAWMLKQVRRIRL